MHQSRFKKLLIYRLFYFFSGNHESSIARVRDVMPGPSRDLSRVLNDDDAI